MELGEPIPPALTDEEWAQIRGDRLSTAGLADNLSEHWSRDPDPGIPKIIAALNDRLAESDPRKITHARLAVLARALDLMPRADDDDHAEYLDASTFVGWLGSYLTRD